MEPRRLTDQMFYILLSLLEPKHGYVSMKFIEEMTNAEVKIGPATMYRTLDTLLSEGVIQMEEDSDNKKVYSITDVGINILKENLQRRKELIEVADKIIKESKK